MSVSGLSKIPDGAKSTGRPLIFIGNHQLFGLDLGVILERWEVQISSPKLRCVQCTSIDMIVSSTIATCALVCSTVIKRLSRLSLYSHIEPCFKHVTEETSYPIVP